MRLLFVTPYYPPYSVGGAEESTFALADALVSRGHEVRGIALLLGDDPAETSVPMELVDVGVRARRRGEPLRPRVFDTPRVQWRVARAIERAASGSDLVHCQTLDLLPAAFIGARRAGRPTVTTLRDLAGICPLGTHMLDPDATTADCRLSRLCRSCLPRYRSLYHAGSPPRDMLVTLARFATARTRSRLLGRCDLVLSISASLERLYRDAGLLRHTHVEVLPNIAGLPSSVQVASSDGSPYAIYAGRVTPGKGLEQLLAAVVTVRQVEPDFRLLIAGHASSEWMARIDRSDGAEFVGHVARRRLSELYDGARLAVVPSIWPEPLGRAALEAAYRSVPVVASRVGGLPDTVVDGETGYLVPPRDAPALAGRMIDLWRDPERAREMGEAARRYVTTRFSGEAIAARAEELYERVLATRS